MKTFNDYNLSKFRHRQAPTNTLAYHKPTTWRMNRAGVTVSCASYRAYTMLQGWGNSFGVYADNFKGVRS